MPASKPPRTSSKAYTKSYKSILYDKPSYLVKLARTNNMDPAVQRWPSRMTEIKEFDKIARYIELIEVVVWWKSLPTKNYVDTSRRKTIPLTNAIPHIRNRIDPLHFHREGMIHITVIRQTKQFHLHRLVELHGRSALADRHISFDSDRSQQE